MDQGQNNFSVRAYFFSAIHVAHLLFAQSHLNFKSTHRLYMERIMLCFVLEPNL